jgi:ABC-type transport system involved in cytochrome c biogenesis permease component
VKAGRVERYSVLTGVLAAAVLSAIIAVQAIVWGLTWFTDSFGATGLIVLATVCAGLTWAVTRGGKR